MGIPLGIQVLVSKATVDPAFKQTLLERRAEAATEIGLELEPAEALLLAATPREQLEAIIQRTFVPEEHRREFLGKAAAAMLAAASVIANGCRRDEPSRGIRPDIPVRKQESAPTSPPPSSPAGDASK